MRKHLLLLAVLAVAVAALPQKVDMLDDGETSGGRRTP